MQNIVAIQAAGGRFYPAYYSPAPMPGRPDVPGPARYKSRAHHTTGFDDLSDAQQAADGLAAEVGAETRPDGGWPTVDLEIPGADVLIVASWGQPAGVVR